MRKKCYRFFGGLLIVQANWLNKMSEKGYRLVQTGKMLYEFEECKPNQVKYCVEFIGHKTKDDAKDYYDFLEDMGYKVFYKNKEPKRNDIIVVDYVDAAKKETYIIKRVIGIGGDHIDIKDNQVYLNGKLLEEDYINGVMTNNEDMSIDIPEGKVFVMGDNRNNSLDSRRLGYFDFDEDVIGRVFFTVPLT